MTKVKFYDFFGKLYDLSQILWLFMTLWPSGRPETLFNSNKFCGPLVYFLSITRMLQHTFHDTSAFDCFDSAILFEFLKRYHLSSNPTLKPFWNYVSPFLDPLLYHYCPDASHIYHGEVLLQTFLSIKEPFVSRWNGRPTSLRHYTQQSRNQYHCLWRTLSASDALLEIMGHRAHPGWKSKLV